MQLRGLTVEVVLLLVVVLAVPGCSLPVSSPTASGRLEPTVATSTTPSDGLGGAGDREFWEPIRDGLANAAEVSRFSALDDMAASADLVVRGRITDTFPTRVIGIGPGDPEGARYYGALVEVETILAGTVRAPGGIIIIEFLFRPGAETTGETTFYLVDKTAVEHVKVDEYSTEIPEDARYFYGLVSSQGVVTKSESGTLELPLAEPGANEEIREEASRTSWRELPLLVQEAAR